MAEVASSRISSLGSVTSARASATRCRWPPESVEALLADHGVVALRQPGDELVVRWASLGGFAMTSSSRGVRGGRRRYWPGQ